MLSVKEEYIISINIIKKAIQLRTLLKELDVGNGLATKLVILEVHNIKLSFNLWLVLYIYFILYF